MAFILDCPFMEDDGFFLQLICDVLSVSSGGERFAGLQLMG